MPNETRVSLDIETTDLNYEKGEIIEIGASKFRGNKVLAEFQTLVKIKKKIPSFVTAITSLKDGDLVNAPELSEVKEKLLAFVGKAAIVGHNVNFDLEFLKAKGIYFPDSKVYDTWRLATLLLRDLPSHSLEVLTSELCIEHLESHRALSDAGAARDLFLKLLSLIKKLDRSSLEAINNFLAAREYVFKPFFLEAVKGKTGRTDKKQKSFDFKNKTKRQLQIKADIKKVEDYFKSEKFRPKTAIKFSAEQLEIISEIENSLRNNEKVFIDSSSLRISQSALLLAAYLKAEKTVLFLRHEKDLKKVLEHDFGQAEKIIGVLPRPVPLSLPENYLCKRRFKDFKAQKGLTSERIHFLTKIILWEKISGTGNFAELNFVFEEKDLLKEINYQEPFCSKKKCPFHASCFYFRAQSLRRQGRVFLALSKNLWREAVFLKDKALIINEADHLGEEYEKNEQVLTLEDSLFWLQSLRRYLKSKMEDDLVRPEVFKVINENITGLENQLTLFFGLIAINLKNSPWLRFGKLGLNEITVKDLEEKKLFESQKNLVRCFNTLEKFLAEFLGETEGDLRLDLEGYLFNLRHLKNLIHAFFTLKDEFLSELVLGEKNIYLTRTPIFESLSSKNFLNSAKRAVVLITSQIDAKIQDYLKINLSLSDFKQKKIKAAAKTEKIVTFLVENFPSENENNFNQTLASLVEQASAKSRLSTVIFFRNKSRIAAFFREEALFLKEKGLTVYYQGLSGGQNKIEKQFLKTDKAVLMVTLRFWETLFLPKDKFENLILVKLPFGIPRALERKKQRGDFIFSSLPRARRTLNEIFGFMIGKKENSRFIILDPKAITASYAADLLSVLGAGSVEKILWKNFGRHL